MIYTITGCSGKAENSPQSRVTDVDIIQVKGAAANEEFAYSGTIEESESIPLSFSTIGNVSRVFVSEGDFIKKGQALAELNNESYKNAYEMSLALEKQAEDAYKRLLPMYKNGNLPEIKIVEVETSLQQAKSALGIAKKNLDDCKLYSPIDGVIGKRAIDPGMEAIPNITSITIVKIEKVFALISISENEISSIKKGSKSEIKIAALDDAEFTGTVEEIGVLANPIAHTYKIKIGIANGKREIKPGMICKVTLNNTRNKNGIVVPSRAVMNDETGKSFVYAINTAQNRANRRYVGTGKLLRDGVEITGGLKEGEEIVITGQQKLADNSLVHIANK